MYSKTLLGQSIVENVVPSWTADGENRPFVVFRDPDTGNVFGLSKDMLAYGFLAIGAPGTGKTNIFNICLKYLLNAQGERDVIVILIRKEITWRILEARFPTVRRLSLEMERSIGNYIVS